MIRLVSVGYATLDIIPSMRGVQSKLERGLAGPMTSAGRTAGGHMAGGMGQSIGSRAKSAMLGPLKAVGVIGAATMVGGFIKGSVQLEAQFSKTMNVLQATTGASGKEMESLSNLAMKMGADTVFSANDASQAMLELARGGIKPAEIQAGALKGTLTLAAAGGLQMGEAANFAVKAMGQFNLKGKDMGSIAAALAGGANASSASVQDMASALAQGGLAANSVGFSIQEATGILAAFSNAGLEGSDAGTSLKTMLDRLQPSTGPTKIAMRDLGLWTSKTGSAFVKANGEFKSAAQIAQLLKKHTEDLTAAERKRLITAAFGSDAQRAATILAKEGAAGLQPLIKATSDQSAAQDQANANMKGTSGALEQLSGSWETLKLKVGKGLAPVIQSGAHALTDFLNVLGGGGGAGHGRMGALMDGFVDHFRNGWDNLRTIWDGISSGWGNLMDSFSNISDKHGGMLDSLIRAFHNLDGVTSSVFGTAAGKYAEGWLTALGKGLEGLANTIQFAGNGFFGFSRTVNSVMAVIVGNVGEAIGFVIDRFADLADAGAALHVPGMEGIAEKIHGIGDDVHGFTDQFVADALKRQNSLDREQYLWNLTGAQADLLKNRMLALPDEVRTLINIPGIADTVAEVNHLAQQYELTPDEVVTFIQAQGTKFTLDQIAQLNHRYDLTPKQIVTLIRQSGMKGSIADVKALQKRFDMTPKQVTTILRQSGGQVTMREANALIKTYGKTPKRVVTLLKQVGKDLTEGQVNQLLERYKLTEKQRTAVLAATDHATWVINGAIAAGKEFDGKVWNATIHTSYTQSGHPPTSAAGRLDTVAAGGGYITGPGTATSDSIPARLSNGEYIVRAAAVQRYGVETFHRLNAMRFASGGPVGRVSGGAVASAPTVASRPGPTIVKIYDVDGQLMGSMRGEIDADRGYQGTLARQGVA